MIFSIYAILFVIMVVSFLITPCNTLKGKFFRRFNRILKKVSDVTLVIGSAFFVILGFYSIYLFIYGITIRNFIFIILALTVILTFLSCILFVLCDKKKHRKLYHKLENSFKFLTSMFFVISVLTIGMGYFIAIETPIYAESKGYIGKINLSNLNVDSDDLDNAIYLTTIDTCSYSYKSVDSEELSFIDGSSVFVEKYENDTYTSEPHIKVFQDNITKHFTNLYGVDLTKSVLTRHLYCIYVPKGSVQ